MMNKRLRFWLIVIGGVLLPLPLIGLFGSYWVGTVEGLSRVQEPAIRPMLHPVEREGTLTYGRECESDSDCDPRLRCFYSMVTQSSYCTDSRCATDRDCPDGFSCQTYVAKNDRDLLNKCSIVGLRQEGQECELLTVDPESGCERELLCQWTCGRPCTPGAPATCPEGFFCQAAPTGAACQPSCAGRACPDGQQCINITGQISICAQVHGKNCQADACGPGQYCSNRSYPWAPGEVWMQCYQPCDMKDSPPCPEGTACSVHGCRPLCSPDGGNPCAERFECQNIPGRPSVCVPDVADHVSP